MGYMCSAFYGFVGNTIVCVISGKPRSGRTAQCAQRVRARSQAEAHGIVFVSKMDKKNYADVANVEVLSVPADAKQFIETMALLLPASRRSAFISFDEFDAVAADDEYVRQIMQVSATINARLFLVTQGRADDVLKRLAQLAQ
jgi:hypothetical protein